jgi:hypothetical protein
VIGKASEIAFGARINVPLAVEREKVKVALLSLIGQSHTTREFVLVNYFAFFGLEMVRL